MGAGRELVNILLRQYEFRKEKKFFKKQNYCAL